LIAFSLVTFINRSPKIRPRNGGRFHSRRTWWPKHHCHAAAAAARTSEPFGDEGKRKITPSGAHQRLQVELGSIGASLPVLQSFPTVIEAPHVELPTEVPGFTNRLNTHCIATTSWLSAYKNK
jgi:hypothetical protein